MKRYLICLFIIVLINGFVNAQEVNINNFSIGNEWNEDVFDLRILDLPQIGVFYCLNDNNIIYRLTMPIAFPMLIITPINVTYATSYWGVSGFLADISLTFVNKFILLRILPIQIWGGIPLSKKGMGIYLLFELALINIFNIKNDNYNKMYLGIGLNTGIKYILSRELEFEMKYENYISYSNINIKNEYIGITFKYRILEPGYYGIW